MHELFLQYIFLNPCSSLYKMLPVNAGFFSFTQPWASSGQVIHNSLFLWLGHSKHGWKARENNFKDQHLMHMDREGTIHHLNCSKAHPVP